MWWMLLLACGEPAVDAEPSAPAQSLRLAIHSPVDEHLAFTDIEPTQAPPPERFSTPPPATLKALTQIDPELGRYWGQGLCGGNPAVQAAVEESMMRFPDRVVLLSQPYADLLSACASPGSCGWVRIKSKGQLKAPMLTLGARCDDQLGEKWWLAPDIPSLAVIRRYQPPGAGRETWRMPFHPRWARALMDRAASLGAAASSDPDVAEGLHRLSVHPDPAAREAAAQLAEALGVPPRNYRELPDRTACATDTALHERAQAGDGLARADLMACWRRVLREDTLTARISAMELVAAEGRGAPAVAASAKRFLEIPSGATLDKVLRASSAIRSASKVPEGAAWATPAEAWEGLGYSIELPTTVEGWPRGWPVVLSRLAALPGSLLGDVIFVEEEDGVVEAFADGLRWEVPRLDDKGRVHASDVLGFLNTIARDRGLDCRYALVEDNVVYAGSTNGVERSRKAGWLQR